MTAAQLIKALQKLNPKTDVEIHVVIDDVLCGWDIASVEHWEPSDDTSPIILSVGTQVTG